jgi:bifunctional non-homologous end joining protein LigD
MSLRRYREKRDFKKTKEPKPISPKKETKQLIFVVQEHHASHLHYDFRLELDGVLKSWAVPKGIPQNEEERRLAIMVEDHPYSYKSFSGVIPEGNYGAGRVYIWDEGTYFIDEKLDKSENGNLIRSGLAKGHLNFYLRGKKTKGYFSLVHIKSEKDNQWLLMRRKNMPRKSSKTQGNGGNGGNGGHASHSPLVHVPVKQTKDKLTQRYPLITKQNIKNINLKGVKKAPFPEQIKPMLATLVEEPFDKKGWSFEIKWDGYRAISQIKKNAVRIYSRNNLTFNDKFPDIVRALSAFSIDTVLDGEIIAIDKQGRPSFQLLQNYMRTKKGHLLYYVFDILYLEGYDLTPLPLNRRRKILQDLLPPTAQIKLSDSIRERGIAFFEVARKNGIEGIIGKDENSVYEMGRRSSQWLKIKIIQEQEAVIGGFTEPSGNRKHFGALVLGVYDEHGKLDYIGHTGGGFDDKSLKELKQKLEKLVTKESPFKERFRTNTPVTWVKPELVCQVKFSEWTSDGIMRQPIFLGLRVDKNPKDVKREKEIPIKKIVSKEPRLKLRPEIMSQPVEESASLPQTKRVKFTHPDKIFWPKEKITKGDVIEFYKDIFPWILPYIKNRPQSLNRYPNGVQEESFYQKDVAGKVPDWIKTVPVSSESHGGENIHYLICNDEDTLLYLANLGCIEINVWNSRIPHLENPDYLVLDFDPLGISFKEVIKAVQVTHDILEDIKAKSFCKTSGATGLHVYVPVGAKYTYEQVKDFAKLVCMLVHKQLPKTTSLERHPNKREKKIYLDFLQNRKGQTMAAAYCLRPYPGAPVSTPLEWKEVKENLDPIKFNIHTIFDRLKSKGDLWKTIDSVGIDMNACLNKMAKKYQQSQ